MTASPVSEPTTIERDEPAAARYRYSVLLTGARRMWRGTGVVVPMIVVNALAQGLLVLPTQSAFAGLVLAVTALVSAVALLASVGVVVAAALDSHGPTRPTWRGVLRRVGGSWLAYVAWTTALFVLVAVGFAFWTWPGAVVLAVGLFVPLAAMDGQSPPGATWSIIRQRPVRWAVTVVAVLALGLIASLLTAVLWFFVPQFVGVVIAGLAWGVLVWWWVTSLAALYLTVSKRRD